MTTVEGPGTPLQSLQDVSSAQWQALARTHIFFGHQSVGGNIMSGVSDVIAARPEIPLRVVESRDVASLSEPAFHHALVGRNDYPVEKFDDFSSVVSSAFATGSGTAMLKLCYVDIHRQTDVEALFSAYQQRVAQLKARNPSLTIVHFTIPLTTVENWKGRLRAAIEGRATERERNAKRHRYNELMRQAYGGTEPLFDIARLESTLPDGRQVVVEVDGDRVPVLVPSYTDDGAHLNATARRMVAEQLLIELARLQPARTSTGPLAAGR